MVRVRLLGELAVEADGRRVGVPAGRPRSLLGWLALHRGAHLRSRLAARFWPDILDANARASLRTALWALRRALGPAADGALIVTRDRAGLSEGPSVWTDVSEFEELVAAGRLVEAVALSRGELLADLDDDWVIEARDAHAERLGEVLGELAARAEGSGDLGGAVDWTRRRAEVDPLAEGVHRDLMRRLADAGEPARALEVYGRLRERLRIESGLAPSPATRELAGRLRADGAAERGGPGAAAGPARAREAPAGRAARGPGWAPGRPFPLPRQLAAELGGPFVGRSAELAVLRRAWERAARGGEGPGSVVLAGEAGIGKTRLIAELARDARRDGGIVLHGAAEREGLVSYRPFLQALGHYVESSSSAELGARVGARAAELALLVPALGARVPEAVSGHVPVDATGLGRMLDAVEALLASLSESAPVLLALDDLHWADRSSAVMLRHLLSSVRASRMLIVAAGRREEPLGSGPLADALADVGDARRPGEVLLGGLGPDEVEELCRAWTGGSDLSASLHAETEGNPLFIRETLRHVGESGPGRARPGLPAGVRGLIGRRLDRLSGHCARTLEIAAVIGRRFELRLLGRLSGLDGDRLAEVLEEAVGAGLLVEAPDAFESFAFSHPLIAETLVDRLTRTRRARVHARVAEALEESGNPDPSTLAHHWCEAGRAGDPDRAVRLATEAAEGASARLAFGEAVDLYGRALSLLAEGDPRRRAVLLRRAVAYQRLEHFVFVRVHGVSVAPAGAARGIRGEGSVGTGPPPGGVSPPRPPGARPPRSPGR